MKTVGFAFKDLKRRKFNTSLTIIALSLCVTAMISTVLIAYNLYLTIPVFATGKLGGSFINVFSGFATVIAYLSILAGATMTYFFVSANMSGRTRDIGIAMAMGSSANQALGSFTTQLLFMILTSCIIGTGAGAFLSYVFVALNRENVPSSGLSINSWSIFVVLIVFAVVAFFFGRMPLVKAVKVRPSQALFPYYLRGVSFKSAKSPAARLGLSFRVAYRAFLRRKTATVSTVICLSIILSTATIASAGTTIAAQTTQNYFRQGVGENVIAVGHTDIVGKYEFFFDKPSQTQEKTTIDYLDSEYAISDSAISELSNIAGVIKVDARLFLEASVFERPKIQVIEQQYVTIGDQRSANAVVFGLDSEQAVNEWFIDGRTLNNEDQYSAILGDSLASNILSSPFVQSVTVFGNDFNVVGVSLDPLNLGFVVYLPLRTLSKTLNQTSRNLLLLRIDPAMQQHVLGEIEKTLSGTEMRFIELNPYIERFSALLGSIWSSFIILSLFFLAIAALCLFAHMTLRIMEQESEYGIVRALGAKPRKALTIILVQAILITLISGIIGISIGLLVSFAFLIPQPAISTGGIVIMIAWPLLTIGFLCASSLYPALKIAKKPIASLLSHS